MTKKGSLERHSEVQFDHRRVYISRTSFHYMPFLNNRFQNAINLFICEKDFHPPLINRKVSFIHLTTNEPFPKELLVFTCLQYKSFENTVGKGGIARYEQFLLFPQCFLPILRAFCLFHHI